MKVEVTDKGAIYVDNTRITNRNTKWGQHTILAEFACDEAADVANECIRRGFSRHVKNIDTRGFGT